MKYFLYFFFILPILFSASCSERETQTGPAHLRIVEMIPNAKMTVTFHPKNESAEKKAVVKGYRKYEPGYYSLAVRVKGEVVYERTYVLGSNVYYTLVVTGLVPDELREKTFSWSYSTSHVFAGGEARVKNHFLPISFMLYDSFHGSSKEATLRVTNVAPNATEITVKSDSKTIAKGLNYPKTGELIYIKPGSKKIKVYYGNIEMAAKIIQIKGGWFYNIFVSNGANYSNKLKLTVLKSRLK